MFISNDQIVRILTETRSRWDPKERAEPYSPIIIQSLTIAIFVGVPLPNRCLIRVQVFRGTRDRELKGRESFQIFAYYSHLPICQIRHSKFQQSVSLEKPP